MSVFTSPMVRRAATRWAQWSLATQFAVAGGVVMLVAMLLVGRWVASRIENAVVRNTANATAQYMESFLSPLSQDLARSDTLPPGAMRALQEIFNNTPLGERVVSFKIWKDGGLVIEASDKSIVGKRFAMDEDLQRAWQGEVAASFSGLNDPENQGERALGLPLLEIYSPIHEVWSGEVIGVAEFYEVATDLSADLANARRNSWLAVAGVMLLIGGSLYAIVLRGSRTIDSQRDALNQQLARLTELSRHNTALRIRVQSAAARASEMNDQSLRQIGADLHDGPAQLMSFAALRLDDLRCAVADPAAIQEFDTVERAVKDAIKEIRSIARGLSLPEIEERGIAELIQSVVDAHSARTGTDVEVQIDAALATDAAPALKICIYRFVQEGLNNAWKHADGIGQRVALTLAGGVLTLIVADKGPGLDAARPPSNEQGGMGLSGLRDRVESLGASFDMRNAAGGGTEMTMVLEMKDT